MKARLTDNVKRSPRLIKLDGELVGIGGSLTTKTGIKVKEATAKQYKEIAEIYPGYFYEQTGEYDESELV